VTLLVDKSSIIILVLCTISFALYSPAESQQPTKTYRIGYLTNSSGFSQESEGTFRQSLRERGYIEEQNLVIDWRFSKGQLDRLPNLAAELVALKSHCIVAVGIAPTIAVKQATHTIPIVMGNADDDPVRHGLVASLNRPGGNVTGFINIGSELAGKRLEILKEIVSRATRVGILFDANGPGGVGHVRESESIAPALGLRIERLELSSPENLEKTFQAAIARGVEAVIVNTAVIVGHNARIIKLAAQMRLPAMYTSSSSVAAGGLMSFSDDPGDRAKRVADYVDKILKGTHPADLPVQQPTKFELVINLKTAKQIGLTMPPNVLARADRVIR
jgi:putative ABC transport system substrate-binding protein